jgi:two-component system LytT family sensor kinase
MKLFWKYYFPPLYGLVNYFTIRLIQDTMSGMHFWERRWLLNGGEMLASMIGAYGIIWVYNRLFRYFDTHWSPVFSYKKIARELLYVFLVNLVYQNAIMTPFVALTDDGLQLSDFADINIVTLLYNIIYYGMVRSTKFLQAYMENKILLEKITNDKLQTELKFLKAQYHPHFLFNALNTIYFQMDEDVRGAKKSIEKFSELLRYQLYDQQHTVAVSQEIHYLEHFIALQQTRSSEKLKLKVDFDNSLNGQQVYPLLFLPLVENAFKYVGGNYNMQVTAAANNNHISFKVENSVPVEIPVKKETGIGLENLQRRLELLYPGRHQLIIERKADSFSAVLTIELN